VLAGYIPHAGKETIVPDRRAVMSAMAELENKGMLPECRDCDHYSGFNCCDVFLNMAVLALSDEMPPNGRCKVCTVEPGNGGGK
jgi:hypothetical protein